MLPRWVWSTPSVMLVAALAKWPYGYYTLLRVVVTICAVAVAVEIKRRDDVAIWFWAFAAVALLFNPLVPVHLTRAVWVPINVGGALLFVAHMYFERDPKRGSR